MKDQQENGIDENKERKNFFMKSNIVIDSGLAARMKPSERAVYDILCRFAHPVSGLCYPSIPTICKLSGYSKTPVCAATKQLSVYDVIEKELVAFKNKKNTKKKPIFRMAYRVLREPKIEPVSIPWKSEQYKTLLRGEGGKFIALPTNSESHTLPANSEGLTLPTNSEQKKNKKELKRLALREEKTSFNVSKEIIEEWKKIKGEEWLKKYLLDHGHSLKLLNGDEPKHKKTVMSERNDQSEAVSPKKDLH